MTVTPEFFGIPEFKMPDYVTALFDVIQAGGTFTTEQFEEAAKWFRYCQDIVDDLQPEPEPESPDTEVRAYQGEDAQPSPCTAPFIPDPYLIRSEALRLAISTQAPSGAGDKDNPMRVVNMASVFEFYLSGRLDDATA